MTTDALSRSTATTRTRTPSRTCRTTTVELDGHRPHAARRADEAQGAVDRHAVASAARCREGVCGSDAMNINGKNGLACLTNMRDAARSPIVLRPLPGLPVIRDLIVDMTQFFKQYHSIKPYLVNDDAAAGEGAAAVARGARGAQRPVRVHPVRVLLDRRARRSGGTPTSSSARPACCRPTASSPTAATRRPASASTTSRIRTACSAATRS